MTLTQTLGLLLFLVSTDQEKAPGEVITVERLRDSIRDVTEDSYALMADFAAQKNAPDAIPSLLELMKDRAPQCDNDVCLSLLKILKKHPGAKCPLDPLLEVVRRRPWTSRQKGSLVLFEALRDPGAWKGREEELNSTLIPLLTSQRSRVTEAALKCLVRVNGKNLGSDPEAWGKFFEARYPGKSLDLEAAVVEMLAVIRPSNQEPFTFEVNGDKAGDAERLVDKLGELRREAQKKGLDLGIVIQSTDDIANKSGEYPPGVKKAIQAVVEHTFRSKQENFSYTVSPGDDVFSPPYLPKRDPKR
jgi:hypothetical protein